jgi:hypothetical protein
MSLYPAWMNKRCCQAIEVEIPCPPCPDPPPGNGGGNGGGGGGGGMTLAYKDRPLPKVSIKKVIVMDDYENINVTVLKVIDLSLNIGGT